MSAAATGAVEAVERIINREGEADAILRQTVEAVAGRMGTGCAIRFVEEATWTDGPAAGPAGDAAEAIPVAYRGDVVAEVVLGRTLDEAERAAVRRIAVLVSPFCLVGWDTGGEDWEP